jgi:hypothetical protein
MAFPVHSLSVANLWFHSFVLCRFRRFAERPCKYSNVVKYTKILAKKLLFFRPCLLDLVEVRLRGKVGRDGLGTFAAFRMLLAKVGAKICCCCQLASHTSAEKIRRLILARLQMSQVHLSFSPYFSLIFSRLFSPLACIAIFNPLKDGLEPSLAIYLHVRLFIILP